jgi:PIN like domain
VADALRQLGLTVIRHDDRFRQGTPDEEWLPKMGAAGWILLTKDDRIRSKSREREILLSAGVRAFVLSSANLTGDQMAAPFVNAARRMQRVVLGEGRAFIASVSSAGRVKLVLRGPSRR